MAERPTLKETPSQTAGPYLHIGMMPRVAGFEGFGRDVGAPASAPQGEAVVVEGTVYDGEGAPVTDAIIEVWQADAEGRPGRFLRVAPDRVSGLFRIETVRPAPLPGPGNHMQAPHLTLWLVARGINVGLHTRVYFPDEAEANAADPLLCAVPPDRQGSLVAAGQGGMYRFDVHLQGPGETVFLDI